MKGGGVASERFGLGPELGVKAGTNQLVIDELARTAERGILGREPRRGEGPTPPSPASPPGVAMLMGGAEPRRFWLRLGVAMAWLGSGSGSGSGSGLGLGLGLG